MVGGDLSDPLAQCRRCNDEEKRSTSDGVHCFFTSAARKILETMTKDNLLEKLRTTFRPGRRARSFKLPAVIWLGIFAAANAMKASMHEILAAARTAVQAGRLKSEAKIAARAAKATAENHATRYYSTEVSAARFRYFEDPGKMQAERRRRAPMRSRSSMRWTSADWPCSDNSKFYVLGT